jgi:tRNA pseudouridine55 synthase
LAELPPEPEAGYLLIDKPAGVTSHAVVARIRRERGREVKVGHAGTLDPFATGLLVVLIGRATRLQRYVLGRPKTYEAKARLGWRSTTGDPDGELTETGRMPESLELPVGTMRQRVPATSAVRVEGERLYRRAHRGEEIGEEERPQREVEVYAAEMLEVGEGWARFRIECSAGTYVRTLIESLGDAYCEELRRTAVGHLELADADEEELHPVGGLVSHLPAIELDEEAALRVVRGQPLELRPPAERAPVRLMLGERLLAIAHEREGELRTEVVLA